MDTYENKSTYGNIKNLAKHKRCKKYKTIPENTRQCQNIQEKTMYKKMQQVPNYKKTKNKKRNKRTNSINKSTRNHRTEETSKHV